MFAFEALRITNKQAKPEDHWDLIDYLKVIKETAEQSKSMIKFDVKGQNRAHSNKIASALASLGYKANRYGDWLYVRWDN